MTIKAPFTPDQVAYLAGWQRSGHVHPFTCANRDDGKHSEAGEGDIGVLVPTVRGWVCRYCDYTQDWAHDFMGEQTEKPR